MKEKNNKNLNKLRKELLKIFENSVSISQEKNIEKENNSNLIDIPTIESETPSSNSQIISQNPENINININLPNNLNTSGVNKIIKSPSSNRRYNIDIKKNETPVYLFLNKNYEDKINSKILYPKNILNYAISENNNNENYYINSNENFNQSKNENKLNLQNIVLQKYKTILQNYKNTNQQPKQNKINVVQTESFFSNPYTFFTNSKNLYLMTNINKNEIKEGNNETNYTTTNTKIENNKNFSKNETTNINKTENINDIIDNSSEKININRNNFSLDNVSYETINKTTKNEKTTNNELSNNTIIENSNISLDKNLQIKNINTSELVQDDINITNNTDLTNVNYNNIDSSNIVKNIKEGDIQTISNFSESNNNSQPVLNSKTTNTQNNNIKFFDTPKYFDIRNDVKNFVSRTVSVKQMLESRNTILEDNNEFLIPAFMDGGIVSKPTVALVGEKEPEILIPKSKLPDLLGSSSGGNEKSALEKTQIEQQTNQLVRTGKQTNIEAIKAINENNKSKEEMKDLDSITKEVNNNRTQNPKLSSPGMNPQIPSNEPTNVSFSSVDSITTTKGTSIFRDMLSPNPIWRIYQG